jgi:hypothetical protein
MYKTVALALAAGLLGGMLTRYIAPPAAYAQNQAPFWWTNRTKLLERSA